MLEFITDTQIYEQVIQDRIPRANTFVWLATADLKDLHVTKGRRIAILGSLRRGNVLIRLIREGE